MLRHADAGTLAAVPDLPRGRAITGISSRFLPSSRLEVMVETMLGIAALLVGAGVLWVCFAYGVYLFTRTGREGMRIQRMEDERRLQTPEH
jgi:hypothetical protein